jgi:hypothetical protein
MMDDQTNFIATELHSFLITPAQFQFLSNGGQKGQAAAKLRSLIDAAMNPQPPQATVTVAVLKLAARLLEMAGDEFGNHGCNDMELENTEENWAILVAYEAWNDPNWDGEMYHGIHDGGKTVAAQDYALMGYCAHVLKEAADATN